MKAYGIMLLVTCIALVALTGCTATSPRGYMPATTPVRATLYLPDTIDNAQACTTDQECVPAQCCHPTGCTGRAAAPSCSAVMCTMSCEGPIDCGAGSCGCVNGVCGVVPVQGTKGLTGQVTSVKLEASPQRYSPMMSSTPGIRLTPIVIGFVAADLNAGGNGTDFEMNAIIFEWNATFGRFLTWDAPEYQVHDIGNPAATDNRTIYWTFTDKPAPAKDPVTITVTARDMTRQGAVLGTSVVTLSWDGDYAVYLDGIR